MLRLQLDLKPKNRYAASAANWIIGQKPTVLFAVRCRSRDGVQPAECRGHVGKVRRIVSGTNPVLWCAGAVAMLLGLGRAVRNRGRETLPFVPIAMPLALIAPWLLLGRDVYAFNSVTITPFLAVMIAYALSWIPRTAGVAIAGTLAAGIVGYAVAHVGTYGVF